MPTFPAPCRGLAAQLIGQFENSPGCIWIGDHPSQLPIFGDRFSDLLNVTPRIHWPMLPRYDARLVQEKRAAAVLRRARCPARLLWSRGVRRPRSVFRSCEDCCADLSRRRKSRAALHEDTCPCRPRHTADERDGCGQNQRAGGGDHKNCQGSNFVTRQPPGCTGNDERGRKKEECEAICNADERRFCGLRCFDHFEDAGIGALIGGGRGTEANCLAGIDRAASE